MCGDGGIAPPFLTSKLDAGDRVRFKSLQLYPGAHWIGEWVGSRVGLDGVEGGKNLLHYRESNPGCPDIPTASNTNATGLIAITQKSMHYYVQRLMDTTHLNLNKNLIFTLSTFHIFMVGLKVVLWSRSIVLEAKTRTEKQMVLSQLWRLCKTPPENTGLLFFWTFPSSGILETRKHDVSETGSVSVLRWKGGRRHLLSWAP
jgi:hypothetical protein